MNRTYPPLVINGHPVPWSFVGYVVKSCGGNWMDAGKVFLRADQAKAKNVPAWIKAGLHRGGWSYTPCKLEYENPTAAREWVEQNIFKLRGGLARASDQLESVLVSMLADIRARKQLTSG